MGEKRYFMDRSESGDWYVIELSHKAEWEKWRDDCEDVEPPYAHYVNDVTDVTFENPSFSGS